MYKIKQFFKRIYNLYRWFPIIWKDQDWDDYYIWEVLKFKLKNQSKYIGTKDRHVSAKRDAEIMMLCTRLIDKLQTECEFHSGRALLVKEIHVSGEQTISTFVKNIEKKVIEIKDVNQFVIPELIRHRYSTIYGTRMIPTMNYDYSTQQCVDGMTMMIMII
jgi:hypothetical protein